MLRGGGKDCVEGEDAVSFAHALDTLKQSGSALLVVGSVPDEAYARASRQMLGDPTAEKPRRRLLVVPEFDGDRGRPRLNALGATTREWARIVVHGATARSAAAQQPPAQVGPGATVPTETAGEGIAGLGITVSTVIDEFDRAAGGLEPAELRVAFDSLPTLLTEYDVETVFRFLHVLTHHVRDVRGMGHFWLPRERTCDIARRFSPLFDATIELKIDGDGVAQRWYFRDLGLASEWLPLLS